MASRTESSENLRNKCAACYKQYNKMEHLVEHMRISFHSAHEPKCGVCQKHCRSFESLREHLIGPLPKIECAKVFSALGCDLCLHIFNGPNALRNHRGTCQLTRAAGPSSRVSRPSMRCTRTMKGPQIAALACKMVGGGSDGSLDLCARVCLVDEEENTMFHTFVKPQIPVTNLRDTAKYPPLMKTSKLSNSLKYLTKSYLGYDIQTGTHDLYEDCAAAMRLYFRMRSQIHPMDYSSGSSDESHKSKFASWRQRELERMNPSSLLEISSSDYYCWCLDSKE